MKHVVMGLVVGAWVLGMIIGHTLKTEASMVHGRAPAVVEMEVENGRSPAVVIE